MSAPAAIAAGRMAAEALMCDTGIMRRPTGRAVQDPVTDREVEILTDLFTGRCRIQASGMQAATAQAGARTTVTTRIQLHLPVSAPEVRVGDIWEVTAVGDLSDLQLLGSRFRVVAPVAKTFATARRLDVEELVA